MRWLGKIWCRHFHGAYWWATPNVSGYRCVCRRCKRTWLVAAQQQSEAEAV